jgi:hypothetical protein
VDGGCGDRRMTSGNRKLMKIADNVAGGVEAFHRCLLVRVDLSHCLCAIQKCLLTQSRQEIGSGDALESRIVVACGDVGPAHALIDQDGIPPVARQVDGSGQTGWSAADNQTVDLLVAFLRAFCRQRSRRASRSPL